MALEEWECCVCHHPMLVVEGAEEDVCPHCQTLVRQDGLPPSEASLEAPVATPLAERCPYCRARLPASGSRARCPRCGRVMS